MGGEKQKINSKFNIVGIGLQIEPNQLDVSPYSLFVGSIRSPETRKKYLQRMGYFFNYLKIYETDPERCFEILTRKSRTDFNWLVNSIFKYLQGHKGRVERKEISSATIHLGQILDPEVSEVCRTAPSSIMWSLIAVIAGIVMI